ncbi:ROK family transcriptional regulator [Cutibacterium sp. WCA-380-WT-3A]|uniref:ROK family transcriptional regulator n=1 Tax=Cutibacterium porci TaxID=2605781 RepID=A0A7K0J4S3_9ACTN|nr:ROK family transcriptional regulator [Cutibacterium porci]MSS44941.1 ROK family transcriptional regulator [Cutibacterium porci]
MPTSNEPIFLSALAINGPTQRADLARLIGVSRTSASNLARILHDDGLIEDLPKPGVAASRYPLSTSPKAGLLAAMVVSDKEVGVSISHLDGSRQATAAAALNPADSPRVWIQTGIQQLQHLIARSYPSEPTPDIRQCLVAVPTQADADTGEVYPSPASRRWIGINALESVSGALMCPVRINNTARVEGLCEHDAAGSDPSSVTCYARFSHGVALSHIVHGEIAAGAHGGSGELGHTVVNMSGPQCSCGNHGCLMQYTSIPALQTRIRRVWPNTEARPPALLDLLATPSGTWPPEATNLLRDAGKIAGNALANVANLLDPDLLVVGGELGVADSPFFDELALTVRQRTLPLISTHLTISHAESSRDLKRVALAATESLRSDTKLMTAICADLTNRSSNQGKTPHMMTRNLPGSRR